MLGIIRKIVKFSVKWYPTYYDYGLQADAVPWNVGQGQNWKAAKLPMFDKSLFFRDDEFPNVSLVVMHSNMNINMDSNKQTNKQTCVQAIKQQTNKQTNKQTCIGI